MIAWRWSVKSFEFLVCSVFRFQNFREVRVELHKPSFVDEGVMGIKSGLAGPEVQLTFLKPFVLSFHMMDHLMLCNVLGRSRMCVSYA
jgi:hypothetical protein